jgi:hypothetical protein
MEARGEIRATTMPDARFIVFFNICKYERTPL